MPVTLFISDLHLDPARPAITALFRDFLTSRAATAEALYILGDLFEAWLGDDDDSPDTRALTEALQQCTAGGTPVYVMRGNRDFLLGERFAEDSGVTLLEDPTVIELYGVPTLLMHGDLLCTDDTEYQAFRAQVRNADWQAALLAKPLAERQAIAREMRDASRAQTTGKPESIMDVNAHTVSDYLRQHHTLQLIHGHTHRPAMHDIELDGQAARRMVLGDWYTQGSVLECTASGCTLQQLSPATS